MERCKFVCKICNYSAQYEKDLAKHFKTQKHTRLANNHKLIKQEIEDCNDVMCSNCGLFFSSNYSLSRHQKNKVCFKKRPKYEKIVQEDCTNQTEVLIELVKSQQEIINQSSKREEQLLEIIKTLKPQTVNNNYGPINIQYIMQNYKDAPTIKALTHDEIQQIEHKPDNTLIDCIAFHQRHKTLHKYIGDIIIDHYKTSDPAQQSLWNSDSSRLHYIVMMELQSNSKDWIRDKEGQQVVKEVIRPILQFIKKEIEEFYQRPVDINDLSRSEIENMVEKRQLLSVVINDIDDKHLEQRILKYISPKFSPTNIIKEDDDEENEMLEDYY